MSARRRLPPVAAGAVAAFVAALLGAAPCVAAQGDERFVLPRQDFVPPAPGTYELPPILAAPEGRVLDTNGATRRLGSYLRGKITLLSFMYTYCTDPAGCPLATATLARVRERLAATPDAARGVQLVSLSFDPEYDPPPVMRLFARTFGGDARDPPWHFLTTASRAQLAPLLAGFGQDASFETDAAETRRIDHTLRVFLIDRRGRVREIYSSAYLLPDVIVNDILTLKLE